MAKGKISKKQQEEIESQKRMERIFQSEKFRKFQDIPIPDTTVNPLMEGEVEGLDILKRTIEGTK